MEAATEPRTAKATRAAQLAAQKKRAEYLRDRGWICVQPGSDLHEAITYAFTFHDSTPADR